MLKAAIVGLGRWGRNLVQSVQGKSGQFQFTHAVVRQPDAVREFAGQHGLKVSTDFAGMLADKSVQAVVLTTPHSLHTQQVVAAAVAGKPVFCEKPLALTRADAEKSIAACRRAGVPLALGYNKRYFPSMRELKRLVDGGELGTILHMEGHFSNESTGRFYTGWRGAQEESPAGALTAPGVHVLDAFLNLSGPARRIEAHLVPHASSADPMDSLAVFGEFANGATGQMACVRTTAQFWRVHVFGRKGWAEALEDTEIVVRKVDEAPRRVTLEKADSLRLQLEAFAQCVESGTPFPMSFEQMLDGVAATEAIIRSIDEKRPIDLARV